MKVLSFIDEVVIRRSGIKPIILASFGIIIEVHVSFGQDYSCGQNKVLICHKGKNTLCISESALQAHLDHGDYLGSCSTNECSVFTIGGEITCINPVVKLLAVPDTSNVTYVWSGPDNFNSTLQSPTTNNPGDYIVTITNTDNGCTDTDTAIVSENISAPGAAANSGILTCINSSVLLSGYSEIPDVTYRWTGPEGYSSTQQYPKTTTPGDYILSVTNPLNGCKSFDTITIQQNNSVPEEVAAIVQDTLTCMQNSVTLTGTSGTSGMTYSWSGPYGFNSTEQTPTVNNPGKYRLTVTDPESGCNSSASVLVENSTWYPTDVITRVSGILTCNDTVVTLTGSSSLSGATYSWLDPNNFTITGNTAVVSVPGEYILTVTNTVNGCSESTNITVKQDIKAPEDLTASVGDTLNCTLTTTILSASTTLNNATYEWTGPEVFTSNEQNTTTVLPGKYNVTATNPDNGCSSVKQVTVIKEECTE